MVNQNIIRILMDYIINKECSPIRNKKDCVSNTKCWWDDEKNFCTRDSRTVETDELKEMVRAVLSEAPLTPPAVQIPKPTSNSLFIVKRVGLADLFSLPRTHFLRQRRLMPYTDFMRFRDVTGLLDEHDERKNPLAKNPPEKINKSKAAEQKYYSMMRANPVFLYAHEEMVQILSPDEHKDKFGTLTIVPGSGIRTLILPGVKPGEEVVLPWRNTTVLFEDEHLLETQMQHANDANLKNPRYTQFDETDDDYVYYTDDEKRDHPVLPSNQEWVIRNGQWTIVGYAGGGRIIRRNRRTRRTRRTRTLRKRKIGKHTISRR